MKHEEIINEIYVLKAVSDFVEFIPPIIVARAEMYSAKNRICKNICLPPF